jgi:RNA polymerase sigma factor (sigma-70 family)
LKIINEEENEKKIKVFQNAFNDPSKPYEAWLEHADRLIKIKLNGRASQPYKAEDIINEIIEKVIDGKRSWDMDRVPDINKFMFMQILSVVDNKYKKEKNLISSEVYNSEDESFYYRDDYTSILNLDEIYKRQDIMEAFSRCYNELETDTEMGLVFLAWKEGKESKEIAEEFGLTVKQVEAIKQKIRRKLKKLNLHLH